MEEDKDEKSELRKRAEAKLAALGEQAQELSEYNSSVLIHELRTHQIELEMQNEALRLSEKTLTEAHDQLSDLYDFAPIGYVTLNDKAIVLQSNIMAASMLESERIKLIGQVFNTFLVDSKAFGEYLHHCLHSKGQLVTEAEIKTQDGKLFVQLTGVAMDKVDHSNTKVVRLAITDITAHRLSHQALNRTLEILENNTSESERISSQEKSELRNAINDMKTYTKLNVERELRMVELKKEINALRKELGRDDEYAIYTSPKSA